MTTLALEIHDASLYAADETGGHDAAPSPGYALIEGEEVVTGAAALARARLRPRFVQHRFWLRLDTEPLGRPFSRGVSSADLAHAHLKSFWSELGSGAERVILTLPGSFSERQLGLVLGIARACEIPVEGMADAAVAAAARYDAPEILHLDAHLHRLVLTVLRRRGGEIVRRRVETVEKAGLVVLNDRLARRIAQLFVHATRFDPLHSAASEQELYRRLPGWLDEIHRGGGAEVACEGGRRRYTLEVLSEDLAGAFETIWGPVLDLVREATPSGSRAALLVTHRLAGLPGFEARMAELRGVDPVALPAGASAAGALGAREAIVAPGEDALPFVTRLPVADDAVPVERTDDESRDDDAKPSPTHLVRDGRAYAIAGEPFLATAPWSHGQPTSNGKAPSCRIRLDDGHAVAESDTRDVYVNDEEITGRVELRAGDRLRVGARGARPLELQLIAVVE